MCIDFIARSGNIKTYIKANLPLIFADFAETVPTDLRLFVQSAGKTQTYRIDYTTLYFLLLYKTYYVLESTTTITADSVPANYESLLH